MSWSRALTGDATFAGARDANARSCNELCTSRGDDS